MSQVLKQNTLRFRFIATNKAFICLARAFQAMLLGIPVARWGASFFSATDYDNKSLLRNPQDLQWSTQLARCALLAGLTRAGAPGSVSLQT